ncbi:succinylglutamic semialdehyde dehydrogenase, partial [Yersinia pestis PY-93]
MSQQRLWQGRG